MSKDLELETYEVESCDVHSDAGDGYRIECPNCGQEVVFATCQWWAPECKCGTWTLNTKAVLEVDD